VKRPTLQFYFDFLCPYSYIALELMRRTLDQKQLEVEYICPGLRTPGVDVDERSFWQPDRWGRIAKAAEKLGLTIRPPAPTANSVLVRRGLRKYAGIGLAEYIGSVFKGVFTAGVDISKERLLIEFLQSDGADIKPLEEALNDSGTALAAAEDSNLWVTQRLRLLPTFSLSNERYAGMIDARGLENFLLRYL